MSGLFFSCFSFNNWKGDRSSFSSKNENKRPPSPSFVYSRTGPLGWSPVISCIYCAPRHIFSQAITVQIKFPPRLYLHHPPGQKQNKKTTESCKYDSSIRSIFLVIISTVHSIILPRIHHHNLFLLSLNY